MADYGPSQAQQGIGALIAGLAGGYSSGLQAQNQAAMQKAYLESLFGRQALKNQGAEAVADVNADAKKYAADHRPAPGGHQPTPLRFDENTTDRNAREAALLAVGLQPGQKFDPSQLTKDQKDNYNAVYKDTYAKAAKAHNANAALRGYKGDANENPPDPYTQAPDTTKPLVSLPFLGDFGSRTVPGAIKPAGVAPPASKWKIE